MPSPGSPMPGAGGFGAPPAAPPAGGRGLIYTVTKIWLTNKLLAIGLIALAVAALAGIVYISIVIPYIGIAIIVFFVGIGIWKVVQKMRGGGQNINVYTAGMNKHVWIKIAIFTAIIILIIMSTMFCDTYAAGGGWLGRICTPISKVKQAIVETVRQAPEAVETALEKQRALAIGDYYTGQVDENAEKQLGVYLEDIKQADVKFYQDLPVTMFATLKAQTLDEKIDITVDCKSEYQSEKPKIFPDPPTFTVDVFEERDIDCTFPAGSLQSGVRPIEFSASFSFKTLAYTKAYFMDQNTLRSLRRENIDPLDQYGIVDKIPVTIYTAGPVGVGMKLENSPIGIDRESDQRVTTIGITVDNQWEGEIISIEDFALIVPGGFELIDIGGFNFSRIACEDLSETVTGCSDELFSIYRISVEMKSVQKGGFKTFRGHLRSSGDDFDKLLGGSPIATHYFKATIRYTYSLIQKKSITIAPVAGMSSGGAGAAGVDLVQPEIASSSANSTSSSITVEWTTNEPTLDNLIYWSSSNPTQQWQAPQSESNFSTSHKTTFTSNILPNKQYFYQIISRDTAGNTKTNAAVAIQTKPETGGTS